MVVSGNVESTSIFRRVIEPEAGTMPRQLAEYFIQLDFKPEDHRLYERLANKAQEGALTTEEAEQLDGFLQVDSMLAIMRLKAQRSLTQHQD